MPSEAIGIHAHPTRKLGLRPADEAGLARMIRLDLAAPGPAGLDVPPVIDHLAAVQAAMVLGANNRFGTCWPTSVANNAILVKASIGQPVTVLDEDVFALYRAAGNPAFDPATGAGDNGVDPVAGFKALAAEGITVTHLAPSGQPDPASKETMTPVCYATFDAGSLPDLHAVTFAAGAALLCLNLAMAQQAQSHASPPLWDYRPGTGEWGGHAVLGGAYNSPASAAALDEVCESWQERVGMTDRFLTRQLDAGYVAVWRELWSHDAFAATVDRALLAAAYEDVTGRPIGAPGWPQ